METTESDEQIQIKGIISWANTVFETKGVTIESLNDFTDGTKFVQILEIFTTQKTKYYEKPNNSFIKSENCVVALKWMQQLGIDIRFITPINLVNGNSRAILSVLYAIKRRFSSGDRIVVRKPHVVQENEGNSPRNRENDKEFYSILNERDSLEKMLEGVFKEFGSYKESRKIVDNNQNGEVEEENNELLDDTNFEMLMNKYQESQAEDKIKKLKDKIKKYKQILVEKDEIISESEKKYQNWKQILMKEMKKLIL